MKQTEAGANLLLAIAEFQADIESKDRYQAIVFARAKILQSGLRSDTLKKA